MMRKLLNSLYLGHASYVCSTVFHYFEATDTEKAIFYLPSNLCEFPAFISCQVLCVPGSLSCPGCTSQAVAQGAGQKPFTLYPVRLTHLGSSRCHHKADGITNRVIYSYLCTMLFIPYRPSRYSMLPVSFISR